MRLKKSIWVAVVLIFLLALTGCSQNQQVIFNAGMNMADVTSLQEHMTMNFQLSGSGFEPADQQQIDQAAMFLNNAQLNLDIKTTGNKEKTVNKSQVAINLAAQGMNIDIPVWVDSDLSGNTPKVTEIIKIPQIAAGALPPQFANKEYMVINPYDMSNMGNAIDMSKLTEFAKTFYSTEIAFLNSYAQRFNPDIDVENMGTQTIQTNDGPKEAQIYQIKISDSQFKNLIRYTVNNFTQDPEAMNFVKQFLEQIIAISQVPDKEKTISEIDQAFNNSKAFIPQFSEKFNSVMDQLNNVSILGDNGIELKYAISGGYCVQDSGSIDFKINLPQIAQFFNTLNGQQNSTADDIKGTLELQVNFKTDVSGINSPLQIEMPQVNNDNSINYFDFIKSQTGGINTPPVRLAGQNRYETAEVIGEKYNHGICSNIILASGDNFTDALSSSTLSKKLNAPILLVGSTPEQSREALDYIHLHSDSDTKIYIIGGTGVIDKSFETALSNDGINNIERLSGNDSYDVNIAVVDRVNADPGTPVFIASGEQFPDGLSVAGFAGSKQYPIILVGQNNISDKAINYLTGNQPSTVYIVGGEGVVSQAVEEQIKNILPKAAIKRLAGNDRFETNNVVVNEFSDNPHIIYLANGYNYPDALAGSSLAAQDGSPILLIDNNDNNLPSEVQAYLRKLHDAGNHPLVLALGGAGVVSDSLIQQANDILNGN